MAETVGRVPRMKALPLAWVTTCRRLLVAGGGSETESRVRHALLFDWLYISVVAPRIPPALHDLRRRDLRVELHARDPVEADVALADFVLEDSGRPETSELIRAWCDAQHKPLNACDKPDLCDAFYMSLVTLGPLALGITSGGDAPAVAAALRRWLEEHLSPGWAAAARQMADLRKALPSGQGRIDLLKKVARDPSFLRCVEENDEEGLRSLITDAVRRMPT